MNFEDKISIPAQEYSTLCRMAGKMESIIEYTMTRKDSDFLDKNIIKAIVGEKHFHRVGEGEDNV